MLDHAQLETVYIYFDTATYDEIERDVKVILMGLRDLKSTLHGLVLDCIAIVFLQL